MPPQNNLTSGGGGGEEADEVVADEQQAADDAAADADAVANPASTQTGPSIDAGDTDGGGQDVTRDPARQQGPSVDAGQDGTGGEPTTTTPTQSDGSQAAADSAADADQSIDAALADAPADLGPSDVAAAASQQPGVGGSETVPPVSESETTGADLLSDPRAGLSSVAETTSEFLGDVGDEVNRDVSRFGGGTAGDVAEGTFEGVAAVANVPATAEGVLTVGELAGKGAVEAGGELAEGDIVGVGEETVGDTVAVGAKAGEVVVDQATDNPAKFGGTLLGSLGASTAAFKATQGTRFARPTRAAIQPLEEAATGTATRLAGATARGQAALDKIPGGRIDIEEIGIAGARRAKGAAGNAVPDRFVSDTSAQLGKSRTRGETGGSDTTPVSERIDNVLGTDIAGTQPRPGVRDRGGGSRGARRGDTGSGGGPSSPRTPSTGSRTGRSRSFRGSESVDPDTTVTATASAPGRVETSLDDVVGEAEQRQDAAQRFEARVDDDLDTGSDTVTRTKLDADTDTTLDTDAAQGPRVDTQTNIDVDTDPGTQRLARTDSLSELETGTDTRTDTDVREDVRTATDTRTDTDTDVDTRTDTRAETRSELRAESAFESAVETERKADIPLEFADTGPQDVEDIDSPGDLERRFEFGVADPDAVLSGEATGATGKQSRTDTSDDVDVFLSDQG